MAYPIPMHRLILTCAISLISTTAVGLAASVAWAAEASIPDLDYAAEHEQWQAERIAFLKGPDGYLNLAGLHWLRAGVYSFGSEKSNDLVFPQKSASRIGTLTLQDDEVQMLVNDGVGVMVDGAAVSQATMSDDRSAAPRTAVHGSVAWTVIRRDDRIAVRVRDFEHPSLATFETPDSFPLDRGYRLAADFVPYETPRIVNVETVIEGLEYKPEAPGTLRFRIDAESYELEAYSSGDKLFLVFGDQTSGRDTYPAGRFLYAEAPDAGGKTVLDFNKAHNPPCAFNEFATCPVASPRNRLATRITAGERFDPRSHDWQ